MNTKNSTVNPVRAEDGWPPVVVAGAYNTGVVLMRNLRRRGLNVSCFDCNPNYVGFRTVYGKAYECPNPDDEPDRWLAFMAGLAGRLGTRPVLIASSDQYVTAIAEHADELEKHFIFCVSSIATQAFLATKQRQYSVAEEHGMPVPRTMVATSPADVAGFAANARFPCILKPIHFREWEACSVHHPFYCTKVVTASGPEELLAQYQRAAEINPTLVVQESIEGPDTAKLVYLSCYAQDGQRIGVCSVRQIRTHPINFGSASVVEPTSDPEAEDLCDSFLRSIGFAGLCEIELKRDVRDGSLMMIEANPRYSVTADAAPYAGVDLGWLHYLDLIGKRVDPVLPSGRSFRHIVLTRDLPTLASYLSAGLLGLGSLLRSYRPPVAFFDVDFRDWRVTASTFATIARSMLRPLYRCIVPRRPRNPALRGPLDPFTGDGPRETHPCPMPEPRESGQGSP